MEPLRKSVPLSGWDVAYAIRFADVNQAIQATTTLPPPLRVEKLVVEDDDFMGPTAYRIVVTADYSGWSLIGTESGSKVGALVKLQNLNFEMQPLQADPNGPYSWQNPTTHAVTTYSATRSAKRQLAGEVGVRLSMNLRWYQAANGGQYELKRDDKVSKIDVQNNFIVHPNDDKGVAQE